MHKRLIYILLLLVFFVPFKAFAFDDICNDVQLTGLMNGPDTLVAGQSYRFTFSVTAGSGPVRINGNWGNPPNQNNPPITRLSSDVSDSLPADHTYGSPGQYTISVIYRGFLQDGDPAQCMIDHTVTVTSGTTPPTPEPTPFVANISVQSNLETQWTLTGPSGFTSQDGAGTTASYTGPAGTYNISAANLSGYSKSIAPASSQDVLLSESISFYITYTYIGDDQPPPEEPPSNDPPPTCSLSANPTSITSGQSSTLTWSSTNATIVVKSWTGGTSTGGSGSVSPSSTTVYSITCTGPGGSASDSATVTVDGDLPPEVPPPPTCSLTADPTSINSGQSSTLFWGSTNATTVTKSWAGGTTISGSDSVSPTVTTVYTVTCTGEGGSASASATVHVNNVPPATPTCSSAAPQALVTSAVSGGFYSYAYGVTGAEEVFFPTWSETGGQEDMVWYQGTYIGNNTWRGAIDLGAHRSGNPDYGSFATHVWMWGADHQWYFCDTANFTREVANQRPIGNLDGVQCDIIGGWAFDPDTVSTNVAIHFYDGSTFLTYTFTNGDRPDVRVPYGLPANSTQGFTIFTPNSVKTGTPHTIYAYAIDSSLNGQNTLLGSATISCAPPSAPTVDINANPTSVYINGTSTISWTSTGAVSCSITASDGSVNWSGISNPGVVTPNLTEAVTYYADCIGPGGHGYDNVTVSIIGSPDLEACTISASPSQGATPFTSTVTLTVSQGYNGDTHQFSYDCTSNNGYEGTTYQTTSSVSFPNACTYSGPSVLTGYIRNMQTQEVNSCTFDVAQAPFNYSLSNSGTSNVTKSSGDVYTQNTITKTLLAGTSQPVTLAVTGVPSGVSAIVSNNPCNPTCASAITFTVTPNAVVGTYPITVTGSPLSKTTSFNLVINANPITVTCSVTPVATTLGQTVTYTSSVSGGAAPLTYAWSGTNIPTLPVPNGASYSRSYDTAGVKTTQLRVTDDNGIQGTCSAVQVHVNFDPLFREF